MYSGVFILSTGLFQNRAVLWILLEQHNETRQKLEGNDDILSICEKILPKMYTS